MTCVSGLGSDLVADHFYYNYCIGTSDLIILLRIVCILYRIQNDLCIGTRIGFGWGSFLLRLLCWDTGLDYFVADCVHTLVDTERLVYQDSDWI